MSFITSYQNEYRPRIKEVSYKIKDLKYKIKDAQYLKFGIEHFFILK